MQAQKDPLKALVRSLRTALKNEHGLDVPYAALRASMLRANGENPHAYGRKAAGEDVQLLRELVQEAPQYFHPGYDFDGAKDAWLQKAGLVKPAQAAKPSKAPRLHGAHANDQMYELNLVQASRKMRLALDPAGEFWLPQDFRFEFTTLVAQRAVMSTRLEDRGYPKWVDDAQSFYGANFGIHVDEMRENSAVVYTQGKDFERTLVVLQMNEKEWLRVLSAVLSNRKCDVDIGATLAEHVGQHYRKNFDTLSEAEQASYFARYLNLSPVKGLQHKVQAVLEWVWPDEDSGSVDATLDTLTGVVTANGNVPEAVLSPMVRVRLTNEERDDDFELEPDNGYDPRTWRLRKFTALCQAMDMLSQDVG